MVEEVRVVAVLVVLAVIEKFTVGGFPAGATEVQSTQSLYGVFFLR